MLFQAQQYCNAFDRTVRILIHPPSLKCCSSVTAPLRGMLPRRASPEPKIDATNVVVFMKWSNKDGLWARGERTKHQIPNAKLQRDPELQIPKPVAGSLPWSLGLGASLVFGVWCLVL